MGGPPFFNRQAPGGDGFRPNRPFLAASGGPPRHQHVSYHKTRPCFAFQNGSCVKGDACNFAHSEEELRSANALMQQQLAALNSGGGGPAPMDYSRPPPPAAQPGVTFSIPPASSSLATAEFGVLAAPPAAGGEHHNNTPSVLPFPSAAQAPYAGGFRALPRPPADPTQQRAPDSAAVFGDDEPPFKRPRHES